MRYLLVVIVVLLCTLLTVTGCTPAATSSTPSSSPSTTAVTTVSPSATTTAATTTSTTVTTTSATSTTAITPANLFTAASPAVKFTSGDIEFLNLDFQGTPREIADAIRQWQEENWDFVAPLGDYIQVSDPIRWNYFLPGIFTSRDIIQQHILNERHYGICFSFAIVYASIAEYYGLEVRIMNSLSKPSDSDPRITMTSGMSEDEYSRLELKLTEINLHYDYEVVYLVAEETPAHYWVEVYCDGQWLIQDATEKATGGNTQLSFKDTGDYEITNWQVHDRSSVMNEYQQMLDAGEPLPLPPGETAIPTPSDDYEGMVDELGQARRAASIDDLIQGLALAPYFFNVADAYEFNRVTGIPPEEITEDQADKEEYERRSGKHLYITGLLVCQDSPPAQVASRYFALCGEELDMALFIELYLDD